tara:strand:+ start:225 stop:599 length:375 start_codon:yes stop_codon:yes gene_type:complete
MASELRVNTLKDASGNNSIATSFVAGGSAKVHVLSNAGAAASESLNVSGMTDNGTGDYTTSFSSAFGDANYVSCAVPSRGLGDTSLSANVHTRAAGSYRCECSRDDSTKTDAANYSSSHFGDLA